MVIRLKARPITRHQMAKHGGVIVVAVVHSETINLIRSESPSEQSQEHLHDLVLGLAARWDTFAFVTKHTMQVWVGCGGEAHKAVEMGRVPKELAGCRITFYAARVFLP